MPSNNLLSGNHRVFAQRFLGDSLQCCFVWETMGKDWSNALRLSFTLATGLIFVDSFYGWTLALCWLLEIHGGQNSCGPCPSDAKRSSRLMQKETQIANRDECPRENDGTRREGVSGTLNLSP